MSYGFREFDDERRWLRQPARRRHPLLLGLLLVPLTLIWLPLGGAAEVDTPPSRRPDRRPAGAGGRTQGA